jgi:hypothetical protein
VYISAFGHTNSGKKKRPRAESTRDVGVGTRLQCPANKKALESGSRIEDFVVRNCGHFIVNA